MLFFVFIQENKTNAMYSTVSTPFPITHHFQSLSTIKPIFLSSNAIKISKTGTFMFNRSWRMAFSQNLFILVAVIEINAKMSSDNLSTHFSSFRLVKSVSARLKLEVDLLCQKIVGFKSVGYQKIL